MVKTWEWPTETLSAFLADYMVTKIYRLAGGNSTDGGWRIMGCVRRRAREWRIGVEAMYGRREPEDLAVGGGGMEERDGRTVLGLAVYFVGWIMVNDWGMTE